MPSINPNYNPTPEPLKRLVDMQLLKDLKEYFDYEVVKQNPDDDEVVRLSRRINAVLKNEV